MQDFNGLLKRHGASPVSLDAGQPSLLRPPPVPVHDDGNVCGDRWRFGVMCLGFASDLHQMDMISVSLDAESLSISTAYLFVMPWTSSSSFFFLSSDHFSDSDLVLISVMMSFLMFLIATFAFSASFFDDLDKLVPSLLCWLGNVKPDRVRPPNCGLRPRSDFCSAFSISLTEFLSYGWMTSCLGSGTDIFASCLSGTIVRNIQH